MTSHDAPGASSPMEAFGHACKSRGPLVFHTRHRMSGVEASYTVLTPFAIVGRSQAAGVRLDDPSISQCHAYFQVVDGEVHCVDCGSRTGVLWEDGSQARGLVKQGHAVRLGAFDVRIELPAHAEPDTGSGVRLSGLLTSGSIEVHSRSYKETNHYSLDRAVTLLGRHPACDLRLLDESIGYFQSSLVNTPDGVWYVDMMSRQGALLNGRQSRFARLRDADLLELGRISLVFRIGARSSGPMPSSHSVAVSDSSSTAAAIVGGATVVPGNVAEVVSGMFMPVGEMVKQFQQCFMSMAQMFTTMQQEHAILVSEQMRQIHEMAEELRSIRTEMRKESTPVPAPAPALPAHPPAVANGSATNNHKPADGNHATPRQPQPNHSLGAEDKFPDAHAWFMQRLATKGQTPPGHPPAGS